MEVSYQIHAILFLIYLNLILLFLKILYLDTAINSLRKEETVTYL